MATTRSTSSDEEFGMYVRDGRIALFSLSYIVDIFEFDHLYCYNEGRGRGLSRAGR